MKDLCEDIIRSHISKIKLLREQSKFVKMHSREPIKDFKIFRKKMLKKLKREFVKNRKELIDKLNSFREAFEKKKEEIKADLEEANKSWKEISQTLEEKRQKF